MAREGKDHPDRDAQFEHINTRMAAQLKRGQPAISVDTIRLWWRRMGRGVYPRARSLLITADGGGSNGSRVRLWKWKPQRLANETGLTIEVCHLPPGTSKWNKIEHRLFSFISRNWRGRPLLTHATIVNLISETKTQAGMTVRCELGRHRYAKSVKISDQQVHAIRLTPDRVHGDWNYAIRPRSKQYTLFADTI